MFLSLSDFYSGFAIPINIIHGSCSRRNSLKYFNFCLRGDLVLVDGWSGNQIFWRLTACDRFRFPTRFFILDVRVRQFLYHSIDDVYLTAVIEPRGDTWTDIKPFWEHVIIHKNWDAIRGKFLREFEFIMNLTMRIINAWIILWND